MQVILAESAGFCMGVRRAVKLARHLAASTGVPVHTDGPLVHNTQVMDQLAAEGVTECADPASASNSILMIRAHGISPARRKMLQRLPLTLEDATCPDVAHTQGLIRKYANMGYNIVIFGDADHPEVTGLLGYAEGTGRVVETVHDVAALPDMERVCLVAQSTQFTDTYEQVADALRARFTDVLVLDTICSSTRMRRKELGELAEHADAIVIVGGRHSANTLRLAALAASLRPTFHVQTAADIRPDDFRGFKRVGLTAGASTPDDVIEDVRRRLVSIE